MPGEGNDEEYEDAVLAPTTPSIFRTPVKGGNGGKLESLSPVVGGRRDDSSTTGPLQFNTLKDSVDPSFFLNNEVTENNEIVKPVSPENNVDYEYDEVDGNGSKTLTELQSCSFTEAYTVPEAGDNILDDEDDDDRGVVGPNLGDDHNDNFNEHESCGSPVSSQGSMKSVDFLYQLTEGIQKGAVQLRKSVEESPGNVLSKETYKFIEGHFQDAHGVDRFLSHFKKDALCTSFYTGACKINSPQAIRAEKELESINANTLLGIIGRVLLKRYGSGRGPLQTRPGKCDTTSDQGFEQMDVDEPCGSSTFPGETNSGRQVTEECFGQPAINNCKDVKLFVSAQPTATCSLAVQNNASKMMPSVPDYRPVADLALPSKGRKRKENPPIKRIVISEETWENAQDHIKENASNKDKQVEKSGQVFFDAVFTQEEVETCTQSGKKGTIKFDKTKIRLIRFAVAFLLQEEGRITTKGFHKAMDDGIIKDLTEIQSSVLKKKVLQEHAYRRRTKKTSKK